MYHLDKDDVYLMSKPIKIYLFKEINQFILGISLILKINTFWKSKFFIRKFLCATAIIPENKCGMRGIFISCVK